MNTPRYPLNRRGFIQMTGALGLGAILAKAPLLGADAPEPRLALREFGKTGIKLPELGFGAMYDTLNNIPVMEQVYQRGIYYWDTAAGYARGNSELGIGAFLAKRPEARKNLFIVTKASRGHTPEDMTRLLNQSLERMKIDTVDLYFMHGMSKIDQVDRPEVKEWAENAKKAGKIRFFGFSTHSDMEQLMLDASKLGWIDGIMMTFNYRNMDTPDMRRAMDACAKAGIGLTAMKVIASGQRRGAPSAPSDSDKVLDPVLAKGFTPGQAKLKAVLQSKQLSIACVQMPNIQYAEEAFAAAANMPPLKTADLAALRRHAEITCNNYCAGCSRLCEGAIAGAVPLRDVLRYQMYHEFYGMENEACEKLAALPAVVRDRLASFDFAPAEAVCPNHLPIAQLMREARSLIA